MDLNRFEKTILDTIKNNPGKKRIDIRNICVPTLMSESFFYRYAKTLEEKGIIVDSLTITEEGERLL